MRDFECPGRSEAFALDAMATTSHPLATFAALEVLRRGGNAMDAAVAAAALLGVVEPTQTGIGGDCFVLYMPAGSSEVIALNGSGWAPAGATLDRYRDRGMNTIPVESADAVTVPGAVASWARLISDYGTMELGELLAPAIAAAEYGYPVSERVARDWAKQVGKLRNHPVAARAFLFDGAAPKPGMIHRQPALAAALRSIAREGPAAFYQGWIAEDMVATLRAAGGPHTLEDFAAFAPEYVTPIRARYRGYDLWECPPNGQGLVPLIMLRALEGYDLAKWSALDVERLHLVAEVGRQAYADRDAHLGDPRSGGVPVGELLSEAHAARVRARIDPTRRAEGMVPFPMPAHNDTAFLAVVDRDRNTVAFINSIFDDFGSGIVCPRSGVVFHNRASGFVLEPGHPNAIGARKRPLHTIIPALLTKDGRAVMTFGVTGGHFQPFGQVQVLSNILDHGMGIQAAIDHPRMFAFGDVVQLESTMPKAVCEGLAARGHRVVPAENPLGTAQAIWIDLEGGILRGGADSRRDGIALGW
ncbi:MAG TPA: gamma-glutamyltransferase [Xanthobacteraceae bacterium]|nr:gamma-glutamyltransferase [Xanthobacteraceae bacterium]